MEAPCNSVCGAMCENGCLFGGCGPVCMFPNDPPPKPPTTGSGSGGSGGGGGVWEPTLAARNPHTGQAFLDAAQAAMAPGFVDRKDALLQFILKDPRAAGVRAALIKSVKGVTVSAEQILAWATLIKTATALGETIVKAVRGLLPTDATNEDLDAINAQTEALMEADAADARSRIK